MKLKLYLILSAILFIITSCGNTFDYKAKESVREYLNKNRIYDFKEREWSKVDSIFFPNKIKEQFEQAYHWVKGDIFLMEHSLEKLNIHKDKDRITILKDSISQLENKLYSMTEKYNAIMSERKPNRKSISLILTYKTPSGIEKTDKYIFVFDEKSWLVTDILDEFYNSVDL